MSEAPESEFPSLTYDRAFLTLFVDSVHMLLASEREADHDIARSLAHGSLACTMLLPEVVANILVETLHLEASVFGDVDRMSALGKLDFYLRTSSRTKKIERGERLVQQLQEIKRLRDVFVHPRPQAVHWKPGEHGHVGESPRTPLLDMCKNPSLWYSDDAIKGMRAVHEFFAFYFRELCKFSKGDTSAILFSEEAKPNRKARTHYVFNRSFLAALRRWNVDVSYFKHGTV